MKKMLLAVFALVSCLVSASFAAPSVTVSEMVKSRYMGGNGVMFSDGPVLQSDLFMSFDNGAWVDLWNSQDLGSEEVGSYANEIDIGAGWAGKVGQSGLSLNVGINYWDTAKTLTWNSTDVWQSFVQLNGAPVVVEKMTIMPYLKVETLRDGGNGDLVDFESKFHLGGNVNQEVSDKVSLFGKADFCYDPGIFGIEAGFFLEYQVGLNVQVTESVTIKPLWANLVVDLDSGENNMVGGLGASIGF